MKEESEKKKEEKAGKEKKRKRRKKEEQVLRGSRRKRCFLLLAGTLEGTGRGSRRRDIFVQKGLEFKEEEQNNAAKHFNA